MTPEFSRIIRLDEIGATKELSLAATQEECAALAARFELLAIGKLNGELALAHEGEAILATGALSAQVTQSCVATGEPVDARIEEHVELRFARTETQSADEIEISADELDTLPIEGEGVDLGEALAQSLALALDPWPRHPNADAHLKASGVVAPEDVGPFAALKKLKLGD